MISVVIPTFNRKALLPRAINSVLRQTYEDFELLVIDDGSTDGTGEMLLANFADKRIRYFRMDINQGVNVARNTGIDEAVGEYIAFLDSDDELFPNTLERVVDVFEQNPTVGCIFGALKTQNGEMTSFNRDVSGVITFNELLCGTGLRKNKGALAALRSSCVGSIRWEAPYLQFIFFRYIAKNTNLYFIAEPVGIYHVDSDHYSVTKLRTAPNVRDSIRQGEILNRFLGDFGDDILRWCPETYGRIAHGALIGLLLGGYKKLALVRSYEALRYDFNLRHVILLLVTLLPWSRQILLLGFKIKSHAVKKD